MFFVAGSCFDPALEHIPLFGGERRLVRLGRGHDLVGIGTQNTLPRFGFGQIARNNGARAVVFGRGAFERVQTQACLAVFGVEPVTGVALVGENGADIPVELDLRDGRGAGGTEDA